MVGIELMLKATNQPNIKTLSGSEKCAIVPRSKKPKNFSSSKLASATLAYTFFPLSTNFCTKHNVFS